MKTKFKSFNLLAVLVSTSSIVLAACTNMSTAVDQSGVLALSVPQIGSTNYALESMATKKDSMQLLIEPLIKVKPSNTIQSFLTSPNLEARQYDANDDGILHAIDFDPSKIQKDSDGYWDPTTGSVQGDDYKADGLKYSSISQYYAGAADVLVMLKQEDSIYLDPSVGSKSVNNRVIRFHIRDNLKWSNNEPVTSADYVTTLKYILDPARGSSNYTSVVNSLQIHNAGLCYLQRSQALQQNPGLTGDQTWNLADACQSSTGVEGVANSGFGVRALANNWVEYEFDNGNSEILQLVWNEAFMPVSDRFIKSLPRGILDFGLSKESLLTNGAFKLDEYSPEYILTANKNPDYWAAVDVFSHRLVLRPVPSLLSQVTLYKSGHLSEINTVPPQFLPILNQDAAVKDTIFRGGSTNILSSLQFSASYFNKHDHLKPMNDPDFRRALYYGLNRVELLEIQNLFGLIPTGLNFPTTAINDYPSPGDSDLLSQLNMSDFRPDFPGVESYKLANYSSFDYKINNYANYLGEAPTDANHKPELAQKFFERWSQKYNLKNVTLPFDFTPTDESLAIDLKKQWENVFAKWNFQVELIPTLNLNMTNKLLTGDYSVTYNALSINDYGFSNFNWYMPYVTTSFAGDRRFANLSRYFGDTLPAYARRLATTPEGIDRLKELGFDPTDAKLSQAANWWDLLQSLDAYLPTDSEEFKTIPEEVNRTKNGNLATWKNPLALQESSPTQEYVFRVANSVGNNQANILIKNGLYVTNPLYPSANNPFGITNGYLFADFLVSLEKLMRDATFSIPISSYSASYFATKIIGEGRGNSYGFPRNLMSAYNFNSNIFNSVGRKLPGAEILGSNI